MSFHAIFRGFWFSAKKPPGSKDCAARHHISCNPNFWVLSWAARRRGLTARRGDMNGAISSYFLNSIMCWCPMGIFLPIWTWIMLECHHLKVHVVIINLKGSFTWGNDSEFLEFDVNDALLKLVWCSRMD